MTSPINSAGSYSADEFHRLSTSRLLNKPIFKMAVHFQLFLPSFLTPTTVHFELILTMEIFWIHESNFCDGFSMHILYDIGWIESCHLDWCLSVLVHVCRVYCNHFLWRHQWSIWILFRGEVANEIISCISKFRYGKLQKKGVEPISSNLILILVFDKSLKTILNYLPVFARSSVRWSLINHFRTLSKVIRSGR